MILGRSNSHYTGRPTSVLIVEHGRLPTTDYFVLPKAESFGVPVVLLDSLQTTPEPSIFSGGTLVIFVRYVDAAWEKAVLRAKAAGRLAGIACFIDDDLLDHRSWGILPAKYQKKIKQLAPKMKWLQKHQISLWVSSHYLQEKYRELAPELVAPLPPERLYSRRAGTTIFYHGTASHRDEAQWLVPVIREVQQNCEHSAFEIFGDLAVNRLYRDIPRVSVLHPMGWENYRAHCARADLHIGLVPLLESPFNAARSTTKFFDIVRCGAVGIYTNREPFRSFIRDQIDGFLVENDPGLWVQRIVSLVNDPELCRRAAVNARQRALSLSHGQG